jgi:hypothetical protein
MPCCQLSEADAADGGARTAGLYRSWEQRLSPTMRQVHIAASGIFVEYAGTSARNPVKARRNRPMEAKLRGARSLQPVANLLAPPKLAYTHRGKRVKRPTHRICGPDAGLGRLGLPRYPNPDTS